MTCRERFVASIGTCQSKRRGGGEVDEVDATRAVDRLRLVDRARDDTTKDFLIYVCGDCLIIVACECVTLAARIHVDGREEATRERAGKSEIRSDV